MKKYLSKLSKYLFRGIFTIVGITLLSFFLGHIAPGDPAYSILTADGVSVPSTEEIEALRTQLGIDKPFIEQYLVWIKQILRGNIGTSYMTNKLILDELLLRIPVTLKVAFFAMGITVSLSLPLGYILALYKDSSLDRLFLWITNIFSAIPGFIISLILMFIFAETLKWLPTSGYNGFFSLILPAFSISLSSTMMITRILRSELLNTFGEEYFLVARSKGFTFRFAAWKHSLPNALGSIFSLWSNYFLAILGGSTIAESIFALPGLGQWILRSINSHDYPAIQAYVLVMGFFCLIIFMINDFLQILIQPKLRGGS